MLKKSSANIFNLLSVPISSLEISKMKVYNIIKNIIILQTCVCVFKVYFLITLCVDFTISYVRLSKNIKLMSIVLILYFYGR